MLAGASEEEVFRQRIQAKESKLLLLTKKFLAFASAIEDSSVEECEALYQGLLLETAAYEFAVGKASALVDTNERQVAEYDGVQQSVEAEMSTTRADIERLTTVLEQERTVRQQKEQYSALARRIHAYPSRGDTQAEIGRLNEEIATLEQESEQVASALELRSKRFAGFMHALHDMQLLLQESEAVPMAE